MNHNFNINGTVYELFSIEQARYGGISKRDAIELLKSKGIKVIANRKYCYTPYVGHYALLIESARAKEAEELLF